MYLDFGKESLPLVSPLRAFDAHFQSTEADHVDLLMLTHMDNDHAGGPMALTGRYPNAERIFGAEACEHNKSWLWNGVRFAVLQDANGASRNDRSCTLLV